MPSRAQRAEPVPYSLQALRLESPKLEEAVTPDFAEHPLHPRQVMQGAQALAECDHPNHRNLREKEMEQDLRELQSSRSSASERCRKFGPLAA